MLRVPNLSLEPSRLTPVNVMARTCLGEDEFRTIVKEATRITASRPVR
jgi:hypothetical protein